jgi:hypothetical protein
MNAKAVTGVVRDHKKRTRGPDQGKRACFGSAARAASLILVVHGLTSCGQAKQEDEVVQTQQGALSLQPWTKIAATFPGGTPGPTNIALLTDGSVLASDAQRSDGDPWYRRYRLRPDSTGSYANGTWTAAASGSFGRNFAPEFVLRDGRYFICGGEYTSDQYELAMHTDNSKVLGRCEIYDPVSDTWTDDTTTPALDLAEGNIADTAGVELDDGRVIVLPHNTTNTYAFSSFGVSPSWSSPGSLAAYPSNLISTEGSCFLQQDAKVFCAHSGFVRYTPGAAGADSWTQLSTAPPVSLKSFDGSDYEIGPALQLHTGRIVVFGANSQTSPNAPPKDADTAILETNGTWTMARAMRTGAANGLPAFNHGDIPSAVMPDGRVLVGSDSDDSGVGNGYNNGSCGSGITCAVTTLYEFDPSFGGGGVWSLIPNPPSTTFTPVGADMHMLNLPSGEVLVTGTNDGSMWLYKPNGTPSSSWRPAITSITGPSAGEYTLNGTQLNGLTTGGGIGDEGLTATNYPIVYLTGGGKRYYARSYNFSHMAPKPGQSSSCKFRLPPGIPNGTYTVFVAANGLSSSSTANTLTIGGVHVSTLSVANPTLGTITLSSAAPAGGTTVTLTSSDTNTLTVPATVTFTSGQIAKNFTATVKAFGSAIVSATTTNSPLGPVSAKMGWTITSFSGASVQRGDRGAPNSVDWLLSFSGPAPSNAVVSLSSSNTNIATVPATVTVPAGARSMAVTITKAGTQRGIARITASAKNTARTWTFSDRDMDFYKCATGDNGSSCFSSILQRYFAYGDNGHVDGRESPYLYGTSIQASTPCSAAQFGGDPDVGTVKNCYLGVYGYSGAREGQSFTLSAPANVAYGANGGFTYKQLTAGTYNCGMSTFDNIDPAYRITKSCYIGPDPTAFAWVADEGGTFSNQSSIAVAYGANGHFVFKILNGTIACNNATFGDPAFNAPKACYKLKLVRLAATEGQAFNPVVSQTIYGSGLNGNMFFSFSAPPHCSFSEIGGDPDFGFNKWCWAE